MYIDRSLEHNESTPNASRSDSARWKTRPGWRMSDSSSPNSWASHKAAAPRSYTRAARVDHNPLAHGKRGRSVSLHSRDAAERESARAAPHAKRFRDRNRPCRQEANDLVRYLPPSPEHQHQHVARNGFGPQPATNSRPSTIGNHEIENTSPALSSRACAGHLPIVCHGRRIAVLAASCTRRTRPATGHLNNQNGPLYAIGVVVGRVEGIHVVSRDSPSTSK